MDPYDHLEQIVFSHGSALSWVIESLLFMSGNLRSSDTYKVRESLFLSQR